MRHTAQVALFSFITSYIIYYPMRTSFPHHPETTALHHGYSPVNTDHRSIETPLHLNTAYAFGDSTEAQAVFELRAPGYIYTRLNNPTTAVLEERLAAYEGGVGSVVTSCGQSAVSTALLTLLRSGDHIVASSSLYGGTFNLLNSTLPKYGIHTTFVDFGDESTIADAITEKTKLIFCEVLGNPKLDVVDVRAVARVAHEHGLPLFVDNTLLSGIYHPIEDGADVVLYSLTKFVCGNGSTLGGAVIDSGCFDWGCGRYAELSEPCDSYHGVRFTEAFGSAAYLVALRAIGLRDLGACISPFSSFSLLQGLETLGVRIQRISDTALRLAQWLEAHPLVEWVRYSGLASHERHALAQERYRGQHGGILTFGPKGGYDVARKVAEGTHLFSLVANFGDSKSLIVHPSSTTHNQLTPEEQSSAGVTPDLIRVAVGLEHIDDLQRDIDQALRAAQH